MYIPLESTLLRFLPLPLQSLFGSYGPSTHSIVPEDQLRPPRAHGHYKLGNLSPYHDAPPFPGVSAHLPDDCTVDQVILLHRHGSRGPGGEQSYVLKLVDTLNGAQDVIRQTDLPPSLEFLKQGYKYELVPEELTVVGRRELFDHGVRFALRYPTFTTDTVVSTTVQRVIDSSHFFSQGFFGRKAENITYLTTKDFPDPVSWLRPWDSCPNLSIDESLQAAQEWGEQYIPPIVDRLNALIPGVGFTFDDIQGALYACPYDLAARFDSPWCDVFTERELRGLEYQLDVSLDHFTGHASRGDPGPVVGAFYIKKLIDRLTNENAQSLYLDFAHDLSILFPFATTELNKDAYPLSPTHLFRQRKFRTTYQTPFAAEMVWERFTCQASFEGPQVRLLLNGETFPLSICQESKGDRGYGTCSLDNFVSANAFSLGVEYHSDFWNATCERA